MPQSPSKHSGTVAQACPHGVGETGKRIQPSHISKQKVKGEQLKRPLMLTSILHVQPFTGVCVYVYPLPLTHNQLEGKRERKKWLVIRLLQT